MMPTRYLIPTIVFVMALSSISTLADVVILKNDKEFRHFGKGYRANHSLERYLWSDTPNDMMLQYSQDSLQGMLWLRSSDIDRQYRLSQLSGHASYLKWMKSRN
jgi:hypothetical protein